MDIGARVSASPALTPAVLGPRNEVWTNRPATNYDGFPVLLRPKPRERMASPICSRPFLQSMRCTACAAAMGVAASSFAHQGEQLGKVSFPTSCDSKVQADFDTGVALLHSYWFGRAAQVFRDVLDKDPGCAIAYWGIAIDLMGNTLAGAPSTQAADEASTMLEQARAVGAKTPRERDWIEAASTYFRDHDKTPLATRLANHLRALESLTRNYPDDFEARVFHALILQASASSADVTYAAQRKSTELLEKLYEQNPEHPG